MPKVGLAGEASLVDFQRCVLDADAKQSGLESPTYSGFGLGNLCTDSLEQSH